MSLLVSRVPRSLESKPKLFGFALGDVLLVFSYLSITNLIFGSTSLKFPVVWMGTLVFGLALYFFKRGKPDSFIEDYAEYQTKPDHYSAGVADSGFRPFKPKLNRN